MDKPNDRRTNWKIIKLNQPAAGLDELHEQDRARYVDDIAERILGPAGRMITFSKTDYTQRHPSNVPVFNANVCIASRGKIWFGDLDLTLDEPLLSELARDLGETIYVLYERDARFQTADAPLLDRHMLKIDPAGRAMHPSWIIRSEDGRLHPR